MRKLLLILFTLLLFSCNKKSDQKVPQNIETSENALSQNKNATTSKTKTSLDLSSSWRLQSTDLGKSGISNINSFNDITKLLNTEQLNKISIITITTGEIQSYSGIENFNNLKILDLSNISIKIDESLFFSAAYGYENPENKRNPCLLINNCTINSLDGLKSSNTLKSLAIYNSAFPYEYTLKLPDSLIYLKLNSINNVYKLIKDSSLTNLEILNLSNSNILSSELIDLINKCPNLKRVCIRNSGVNEENLPESIRQLLAGEDEYF